MFNILPAVFPGAGGGCGGARDTPAIYHFLKSVFAQFSKPFFSKPIFYHRDDGTVLVLTEQDVVFMQKQKMCLAVTIGTCLMCKTKCFICTCITPLVLGLNV